MASLQYTTVESYSGAIFVRVKRFDSAAPPTSKPAAAQPTAASAPAPTQAPASQPTQAAPAATPGQARRGGMLRVGLDVDADTLDPRLSKNTSGFRVKELPVTHLPREAGSATGDRPDVILRALKEMTAFWIKSRLLRQDG